ncbi:MAG: hypothetical protein HKO65_16190 [Gemmatimonadetes bacterium]|nr:hypothetical protein [Gemmatimonadota bacterium]NNM06635.1 hypothetical protein [Gemmatimonadota bacterium]
MTKPIISSKNLLPLLTSLMVVGCTWGFGTPGGDIPEMHRNLSKTVDIQTGVVQGDLEKAKAAASWLLEREAGGLWPAGGEQYRQALLNSADRITEAQAVEEVALETGRLAASCGGCHMAQKGGPRFVVGSEAPGGESQEAQMIRHLWAADRLWEGLVGPSEEAWAAGALAMAETQPALARAFRDSPAFGRIGAFLEEVNLLAREAVDAEDLDERADVYGRLLATCDRCHSIGWGPAQK